MKEIRIEKIIEPKILKKKSIIYINENNITLCPICEEEIPLIRPVIDGNNNIKLIFTCYKLLKSFKLKRTELYNIMKTKFEINEHEYNDNNMNNIYIELSKNLFINKKLNQNIYEIKNYLEFLNKIKLEKNNPCYFHSNIYETIYCINCDKYFCKECEIFHNDLQQEHILSKITIKINEFCLNNIFNFSNNQFYSFKYYCQLCKNFFCKNCKNSKCNSEYYKNVEHIFLSMNSKYRKEEHIFKLNNFEEKISKIIEEIKNKNNNLLKKINNSFNNEIKNDLNLLIKKNEENNKMIKVLGEKIYQTFINYINYPIYSIIQNLLNFYNFNSNFLNFEENKFNKDYLFNYYNNNYIINFPYFKKFKCIEIKNFQNIEYIVKNENNNNYAFYGEYLSNDKSIVFLNNKLNPGLFHIENNIIGEVTSMLFMKNKYLILAYYDNLNNESKLNIYNINNIFQQCEPVTVDQNKVTSLCSNKENYFFTTTYSLKLWMINGDNITFNKEIKIYKKEISHIIKYENDIFFYAKGNKVKKYKNEIFKTNIKHWNKITSLLKIENHNDNKNNINNNDNNLLLTSGNDFRIILWSFKLNNNEYNEVSELFFDYQIKCINKFNENIFCCELKDNILNFFKIDYNNLSLKRIWYYNLNEYQIGKCFYLKNENDSNDNDYKDKICFIIRNKDEKNFGLSIFEETEKDNNIDILNEIIFY